MTTALVANRDQSYVKNDWNLTEFGYCVCPFWWVVVQIPGGASHNNPPSEIMTMASTQVPQLTGNGQ